MRGPGQFNLPWYIPHRLMRNLGPGFFAGFIPLTGKDFMFRTVLLIMGLSVFWLVSCSQGNKTVEQQSKGKMEFKKLTTEEEYVIVNKGTERPYSGKYEKFSEKGTYVCKR